MGRAQTSLPLPLRDMSAGGGVDATLLLELPGAAVTVGHAHGGAAAAAEVDEKAAASVGRPLVAPAEGEAAAAAATDADAAPETPTDSSSTPATLRVLLVAGAAPGGGDLVMCCVGDARAWALTKGVAVKRRGEGEAYARAFVLPDGVYLLTFGAGGARPEPEGLERLDALLSEHAALEPLEEVAGAPASRWLERADGASEFLAGTVHMVQTGLQAAVPVLATGIESAGEMVKSRLEPSDEPVELSEATKQRVEKTKRYAQVAATVSSQAVGCATHAAANAADGLATRLRKSGLGGRLMAMGAAGSSDKTQAAAKVAQAGMGAFVAISEGLFDASKVVAKAAAATTADVVKHKYGEEAGKATEDGAEALGDGIEAVTSLRKAGPKALAKNALKQSIGSQLAAAEAEGLAEGAAAEKQPQTL